MQRLLFSKDNDEDEGTIKKWINEWLQRKNNEEGYEEKSSSSDSDDDKGVTMPIPQGIPGLYYIKPHNHIALSIARKLVRLI